MTWLPRRPDVDEAPAVAALARASRQSAMPWLPDLHSPEEDVAFYAGELRSSDGWVVDADGRIAGFGLVRDGRLGHLYVAPDRRGQGIGSALLDRILRDHAELDLWVFERNTAARAFYGARGFVEVERTDGAGNEEGLPDARMRWTGGLVVRRAEPADAAAMAEVHTRGWQSAYRGLIADGFLDGIVPAEREARWAAALAAPGDDDIVTLVGVSDGRVVGLAAFGAPRDDDLRASAESWAELRALYVDPRHWGRGTGAALWQGGLARLPESVTSVAAWVLRDNAPARAFYAAQGLCPDGVIRTREIGGEPAPEVRLAGRLPRTAADS